MATREGSGEEHDTNLILFMVFSAFADIWLTEFFYLLIGFPPMMLYAWLSGERGLRAAPSLAPVRPGAWAFAR